MKFSTVYKFLFILVSSLYTHSGFSQKANRRFIDSTLSSNDNAFRLSQHPIYVINGVPYDTSKLDSALGVFENKHLLDVIFWDGKNNGDYPFYGDAVIIVFAHNQRSKSKRKAWKAAKKIYDDKSNMPVLLVDNIRIDPAKSKNSVDSGPC